MTTVTVMELWRGKLRVAMIDLPERPYATINEARRKVAGGFGTDGRLSVEAQISNRDFWPCPTCHGSGRVYDPNEQADPIEGHKFCRKIACGECKEGNVGFKKFREFYRAEISRWKGERDKALRLCAEVRDIASKMSDKEIRIMCNALWSRPTYGWNKTKIIKRKI